MSLIDRGRVMIDYLEYVGRNDSYKAKFEALCKAVDESPTVEAIPVSIVRDYLQNVLKEWNDLGDRKYELPNMQVYNHVRKCLDDLERWVEDNA